MLRLDQLLVQQGLASSRTQAQKLIDSGSVQHFAEGRWQTLHKAALKLPPDSRLQTQALAELAFASRAGLKLQGALQHLNLNPAGWQCLDIGQSTGGFTDCLLQQDAAQVVGVDVGQGQLLARLREHPRVVCLEGINARHMPTQNLLAYAPAGFDLLVMDVSFISQCLIHPHLAALLRPEGWLVSLVKPQFEAGKAHLGKGGLVKSPDVYPEVQARICESLAEAGLAVKAYFQSPITGGDGNQEFFVAAMAPEQAG
jgi:23S rRNA (cytidine1920-2'-O)/16S rRNA (cytidine1409-2'-O)-methyltransferase